MAWSWLEKVGHDIVAIFEKAEPVVAGVQAIATPFENIFFPGLAPLINGTLVAIANAEATGVAAAKDASGNNAAKLASVVAAVAPQLQSVVTAAGFSYDSPSAITFVNAIVAAANAFKQTQTPVLTASVPVPTTVTK